MRRSITVAAPLLCLCLLLPCLATAQGAEGQRKIVKKVIPHYPELARPMRLEGIVKLTVLVAPNGSVKSMQAVGGNPLLLQAAQIAIQGWKWEPARQESQESVELRFHPN
jgi:TonB family protein